MSNYEQLKPDYIIPKFILSFQGFWSQSVIGDTLVLQSVIADFYNKS